jgi:hypothetical protein
MMEIDRFKGDRHYVHATDELLFAEPLLANARQLIFTSRKVGTYMARWREAHAEADEAEVTEQLQPIARLVTIASDGSRRTFECLQDPLRPITAQIPFDEDVMTDAAIIEGDTLTCPLRENFTVWEHLSTLQKRLLQKVIGHPQWYFVRLELDLPSPWWTAAGRPTSLSLRYRQQKGPLYLSDVSFDDKKIGEIGFAKR